MLIRPAQETDAPAMGQVMVETFLHAHKGQVPEEAWRKRQEEWTPAVSAANWARSILALAADEQSHNCIYVAVADETQPEQVIGLAMGGPAGVTSWEQAGEVYALYVAFSHQGQGVGRSLIRAVVNHLRPLGMTELIIRCLATNTAGKHFYESIGGQVVDESPGDEYGYPTGEYIYHWPDSAALLAEPTPGGKLVTA